MGTSLFYLILAMGTIFMRMLVNLLLSCAIGTIFMPMLANLLLSCARNNIYAYVGEHIYSYVGEHIALLDANYCLIWQMSSDSDSEDDNSYETMRNLVMHQQHNMNMLCSGAAVIFGKYCESWVMTAEPRKSI